MKKILITGVAGLLGTHFSRHLLDQGYDVLGVDNLSGGYIENIDSRLLTNAHFSAIDLVNLKDVENVFENYRPDVVFHFAAYAAEGLSPFIRNFNYQNNILCSINIVNSCIKYNVGKLIFSSSMAVYGHGNPPFNETQQPSPIDPYGIAKYAVELDLKQAHTQFGLNYTIIRPHNIIGVYQNIWDRYRNVIGIWIHQVLNNQPILIFGDGTQQRAFSDIQYYMSPFEKTINNFNEETFNIGADNYYKIIDAAHILKSIVEKYNYECNIQHEEPRHEVKNAYCDHTKAKSMLNFTDNTKIEEVIEKMFLWAKDQPERPVRSIDYELDKGIYSYWKK